MDIYIYINIWIWLGPHQRQEAQSRVTNVYAMQYGQVQVKQHVVPERRPWKRKCTLATIC